jgi:hypothetical protein
MQYNRKIIKTNDEVCGSYKSEERSDRKSGILGYETAPWLTLATLSGKLCGSSG